MTAIVDTATMDDPDDFELLRRWRGGDDDAGSTLFERHFVAVNRFFRGKIDGGVEDLVQATFLACVESSDRFEGRSGFRSYLLGIARNHLLGFYKKRKPSVDFEQMSVEDLGASPSQVIAGREEERILLRALRCLPLDHQITLELFYWENLKGHELAEVLDISPHTVRSRLNRARTSLRETIERLANDPRAAQSTLGDLDGWARGLREHLT